MKKEQLVRTLRILADRIEKRPETDHDFPDLLMEVVGVGIDVLCLPSPQAEPNAVNFYPSPSLLRVTPNGSIMASYNKFRLIVAGSVIGVTSEAQSQKWMRDLKEAAAVMVKQLQEMKLAAAPENPNTPGN